jgi:methyl-accepting chemotaxis protein
MQWFYNLKIATKLRLAFAIVLVLTSLLGAVAFIQIDKVNQSTTELATNWMLSVGSAQEIKAAMARFRVQELQKINNAQDNADISRYAKMMADIYAGVQKAQREYEPLIATEEEKTLYAEYKRLLEQYMVENARMNAMLEAGKPDEARALMRSESSKITIAMNKTIERIVTLNIEGGKNAHAAAIETFKQAQIWIASLLGACILLGLGLAMFIGRAIANPLREAVTVATNVAQGDLTSTINSTSRDETGQMLQALRHMNDSLVKIVSEVRTGTETIASASGQIASGNMDLSARTEGQAASLEETAASIEELTSTVKQNADNARQANQLAVSASEVAAQGGQLVSEVVGTMASISQSADKIADIIGVIDGIAFQTNILALNAAVEAARAGAEGRGFAVVASEVRALAQRSAAAAKEIKDLIHDSLDKIQTGSSLVDRTGTTMDEIVNRVKSVTDIMGEISAASQEQTSGIEQINQSVAQMDQATQQNAALVEEAAAASESMRDQAARLSEAVSVFKLQAGAGQNFASKVAAPSQVSRAQALPKPAAKPARKQLAKPVAQASRELSKPANPPAQRVPALAEDWTEF